MQAQTELPDCDVLLMGENVLKCENPSACKPMFNSTTFASARNNHSLVRRRLLLNNQILCKLGLGSFALQTMLELQCHLHIFEHHLAPIERSCANSKQCSAQYWTLHIASPSAYIWGELYIWGQNRRRLVGWKLLTNTKCYLQQFVECWLPIAL